MVSLKMINIIIICMTILMSTSIYSMKIDNTGIKNVKNVIVFGASGGVGQQICNSLIQTKKFSVTAISRDISKLNEYNLLSQCNTVYADARIKDTITNVLSNLEQDNPMNDNLEAIIISVGTTAFPTSKWKDGNNPKAACYDTVDNILQSINQMKIKPKKVVLLSSIGVDRRDMFPFKILNLYGVLEEKKKSEDLLIQKCLDMGIIGIICRPGRLVGAPFTNFDLAKLLNKDQGENKGIVIDTRDILVGDVERKDVADSITRMLLCNNNELQINPIIYSIINRPGNSPNDFEWGKLLSLFTVKNTDMLTTRTSS